MGKNQNESSAAGLLKYITPLGAFALAFGCSVGWGSFVMPGTTFLPLAGPLGSVIGIAIGGLIMLVIAVNYHFLMKRHPDAGGTYAYTKTYFGYDHGFLSGWFLILTYVAILWANATALPLIARNLLGGVFQFGFHYQLAGFDVYFGEVLLSILALAVAAFLCFRGKVGVRAQIIMALLLIIGVIVCVVGAVTNSQNPADVMAEPFSPEHGPVFGIISIVALAPWAFVGFESISHSSAEFKFPLKKSFRIMLVAVIVAAVIYSALVLLAVTVLPEGCTSWSDYINNLGDYSGVAGLPTFFAAVSTMGKAGGIIIFLTALGAIMTGLIGNYIASSRLLFSMSQDNMMPKSFGKLDRNNVPRNAIIFILCISVILPFFGRTAISWIVDVTTVGATIIYAYVSAAALRVARVEKNKGMLFAGVLGVIISVLFVIYFLIPNLLYVTTLSTESYLILAAWGILGLAFFFFVFKKDTALRLGRSTITWIVLLALIIFTSTVWMRQETKNSTDRATEEIESVIEEAGDTGEIDVERIDEIVSGVRDSLNTNSLVQTVLIVVALVFLFMIYSLMQKREKQAQVEKVLAEESSRAKTSFLSNMSHEIRTPMNAIIGLDNIALKDPDLSPNTREQLEKIGASAKHLLGLINDILDMSRIESGRMTIKQEEFAFRDFLDQINVMINGQCADKGLDYECHIVGNVNDFYVGDDMKLKQVLINILGNAVKFTNVPGSVSLTVEQINQFEEHCTLRFIIADTGIGMSKDYIPKIFDAFSQEEGATTTANKYGSTGLGMAITKNIVEMMNGEIHVDSEKGVGTTFTVTVTLKASGRSVHYEYNGKLPDGLKMIVIDDDEVACEHARLVADAIGLNSDFCTGVEEALEKIKAKREAGDPYDFVLTDYKMPVMNGIEFTRALRKLDNGETAVIIMTGYSWDDMQKEALEAGVDSIMSKPLFTDSLLRQINKVLDQRLENAGGKTAEDAAAADNAEGALQGLHVLVAEDFEINAEILIDLLDMEGITAEHAENGQIAVDIFVSHPENHFDAILMDIRMPVMDGLTATKTIRGLERPDAKTIPIIALTANAFDEDVQRSLQAGMSAHLSKPVEPDKLYEMLEKLTR